MKNEKGKPLTYWGGLADEAFEKESAINELAEEVYGKNVVPDYEEGFIDGYNKAKETLYTKEDMCIAFHARDDSWIHYEEFIDQFKKK
jgi:hypothetical protein